MKAGLLEQLLRIQSWTQSIAKTIFSFEFYQITRSQVTLVNERIQASHCAVLAAFETLIKLKKECDGYLMFDLMDTRFVPTMLNTLGLKGD